MQFKHILASIDVSDDLAEKVLKIASDLAKRDGAKLQAVSVWPSINAGACGMATDPSAAAGTASQMIIDQHDSGREACQVQLTRLVTNVAPEAEAIVLDGDASTEIAKYAEKIDADLIVTGSHQRGFWGSLFTGSESRGVVHDAPCSVFVVTKRSVQQN